MSRISDFDVYPFSSTQNEGKRMDFLQFSSQVKIRHLRQTLQLNNDIENDLVLKLVDDCLVSCYTSLTTKISHFVWTITLSNLYQFQKDIVCWNQHEKFYLFIKLAENLRWWVDFSIFLFHLT